jgi:hypothetical protein
VDRFEFEDQRLNDGLVGVPYEIERAHFSAKTGLIELD